MILLVFFSLLFNKFDASVFSSPFFSLSVIIFFSTLTLSFPCVNPTPLQFEILCFSVISAGFLNPYQHLTIQNNKNLLQIPFNFTLSHSMPIIKTESYAMVMLVENLSIADFQEKRDMTHIERDSSLSLCVHTLVSVHRSISKFVFVVMYTHMFVHKFLVVIFSIYTLESMGIISEYI